MVGHLLLTAAGGSWRTGAAGAVVREVVACRALLTGCSWSRGQDEHVLEHATAGQDAAGQDVGGQDRVGGGEVDHARLAQALARLARAATGDFAVDDMLRELCTATAEVLRVDGAGVMGVLDEDGQRRRARFVHADQATLAMEQLQDALREGPCRQAIETGEVVAITDLREHRGRWDAFVAAALAAQLQAVLAVPLRSRGRSWGSLDLYRRTGAPWDEASVAAARLLADVAVSYLVMAHDRDVAAAANRELQHRSLHDQLTGLPNRGLLFDRIEHALGTARRRRGLVALMFIDLDRFKDVNDTFGHGAGDEVLIELSARMGATLRAGDTLARLAGDEFVLLCEELPEDAEGLHRTLALITSRLRAVLAQPVRVEGVDVLVSASIGVAVTTTTPSATTPSGTGATALSAQALSAETLLHEADTAMYAAKAAGRSRVVTHDHAFGAGRSFGRRLERELAHALERDQLRLHYQPVIDVRDGHVQAVEALLRWQHPEHGLLVAADFIDRAEAAGALPGIGRWVIEAACTQLAAWREQLGARAPATVFCNLRPRELADASTTAVIVASLAAHGLSPADLGLEILEEVFTDPLLLPAVGGYSRRGHPVAIDDFGTGYSSLSRLVGLPVAYAKIDRGFVAGLPEDARSRALVEAVLAVAASLGVRVIAEGVENQAQREHLAGAGVRLLQGYHLARPQSAQEITTLLAGEV